MITTPTVLILGAGTSMNYGFPSGQALKNLVVNKLRTEPDRVALGGFDKAEIDRFCEELGYSGQSSVDAFLEHRKEFVELGKFTMSAVLCPLENIPNLFIENPRDDEWYPYLFQRLGASFDQFGDNKLSVITYNYDRSLEAYLYVALKNTYGRPHDEVVRMLQTIPIVHLHGQLGPLPWQHSASREYRPTSDPRELILAAKSIKIISENFDLANDTAFQEAFSLIAKATRVVFLGFGYNETNLSRIKDCFTPSQDVLGGFYNFTQREVEQIRRRFHEMRATTVPDITPGATHLKTLMLLRELVAL